MTGRRGEGPILFATTIVNGLFIQNSKELSSKILQKPFYELKLRLSSNLAHKKMANPQKSYFNSKGQGFSR